LKLPLILVAALLALTSCSDSTPSPSGKVSIHFTCDVKGRLEPCGCFTGQLGGLTRVKTWLDASGGPSLRVDVGDALAGSEDYEIIQFRHLLQAFAQLGYHAVNLGRREAALPADTLRDLAKTSPVPLTSANLLDTTTGQPLLPPFVTTQVGTIRYGLIGILDPASTRTDHLGPGLSLADPASALRPQLDQIAPQVDVLVLLAFATEARMKELASEFFEFHFILGGDVPQPSQDLIRANRSLLLATTNEGRALGHLSATLSQGRLTDPTHAISLMHEDIPQHPAILALVKAYRDEIRRTPLAIDDPHRIGPDDVPGLRTGPQYVGTETCLGCHQDDHSKWAATGHAHAWDALKRRDSESDPNCIACHSVGFGTPSGYQRAMNGERLVNVGCESCHGPGSQHVTQRASGQDITFFFRPLGPADCTTCHHGEFSRPFDYPDFWPAIQHGKKAAE